MAGTKKYFVLIGYSDEVGFSMMTWPEIIEAGSPEEAEEKAVADHKGETDFLGAECEREATEEDVLMWENPCEEYSEEDAWEDKMKRWAEA